MRTAAALLVVAVTALAACAPVEESPAPSASSSDCTPTKLKTLTAGRLTIGTDDPIYPPWLVDNNPANNAGFESAVAFAVADRLGYARDQVVWTRVTFNNAIAPGPKAYDFDINEFSITEDRKKAVDFSAPYYDVTQAVITVKGSKIAGVKTLAELKGARLGAQVGTTSYRAITEVIKPSGPPQVYNNNDDAKKALQNGQIDGLVVDLPTAFYITSAEVDGVIVGQVPQPSGTPEQFGLVLDKGSPLTTCVSRAVEQLRTDKLLQMLQERWLSGVAGAPVLT